MVISFYRYTGHSSCANVPVPLYCYIFWSERHNHDDRASLRKQAVWPFVLFHYIHCITLILHCRALINGNTDSAKFIKMNWIIDEIIKLDSWRIISIFSASALGRFSACIMLAFLTHAEAGYVLSLSWNHLSLFKLWTMSLHQIWLDR